MRFRLYLQTRVVAVKRPNVSIHHRICYYTCTSGTIVYTTMNSLINFFYIDKDTCGVKLCLSLFQSS